MSESLRRLQESVDFARDKPVRFMRSIFDAPLREAFEIAKHESRWLITSAAEKRLSTVDTERFSYLSPRTIQGLGMMADYSARYLGKNVATDRFNAHHTKRRQWRNGLLRRFQQGKILREYFKSNRLCKNTITSLIAAANIAERRLREDAASHEYGDDLYKVVGALWEIQKIGSMNWKGKLPGMIGETSMPFGDAYNLMSNGQKRRIADEVAVMANDFLIEINPKISPANK